MQKKMEKKFLVSEIIASFNSASSGSPWRLSKCPLKQDFFRHLFKELFRRP